MIAFSRGSYHLSRQDRPSRHIFIMSRMKYSCMKMTDEIHHHVSWFTSWKIHDLLWLFDNSVKWNRWMFSGEHASSTHLDTWVEWSQMLLHEWKFRANNKKTELNYYMLVSLIVQPHKQPHLRFELLWFCSWNCGRATKVIHLLTQSWIIATDTQCVHALFTVSRFVD